MTQTLITPANLLNFVQGTVTGTDETITLLRLITSGGVAIQLSGTWTGTVTFEATVNGTNWVAFNVTPSNSGTDASTATAVGCWSKQNNGYTAVRCRFSTASSGTATVSIRSVQQRV